MRLLAISDLHLSAPTNMEALADLPAFPDDWLILAGDVSEHPGHLRDAIDMLSARFGKLIWVPGNHDLWTVSDTMGGERKYNALVELARSRGVVTPEDPYPIWSGGGGPCVIVPLFLLYDYSFRPNHVPLDGVVAWAREENAVCADEVLLDPAPYASRASWCAERCRLSSQRLEDVGAGVPKILVNHFPLRRDVVRIPRIPRFTPWCGTVVTEDWHTRFKAKVVISGHLHVRRTDWRDGTRFEEVSLGYPHQWDRRLGIAHYLREILPGPST
jgi:predicted phosphodiesterase